MLGRILVQFTKEDEVNYLCKYVKVLKKQYSHVEIVGIYVKDIERYPTSSIYGAGEKWNELEDEHAKTIKKKFLELMPEAEFHIKSGHVSNIILQELRLFDFLLMAKPDKITHELKEILRVHHKPVLLVPNLNSYSFNNILVADDQKFEVNKAFMDFMRIFENINSYKALTVNSDEDEVIDMNIYLKKIDKKIEYLFKTGNESEFIIETSKDSDLVIMGSLKYSIIFEKMAGKTGIQLVENLNKPIFIG